MSSNQSVQIDSSISSRNELDNDEQNVLLKRLEQANERVRGWALSFDHELVSGLDY